MKHDISALMDGELFEDEAVALLNKLKKDTHSQREWQTYHLIGDALRQPDHVGKDISAAFRERLQAEPTVFAPRRRATQRARYFAFSAAASVMALALVAWLSMQAGSEPAPQIASVQQQTPVRPASFPSTNSVNDYLMAHQEFSPSADVQGAASYIHTVSEER
ncbi:MAG: anti-sigma factor [Gallionellaceae bacterium]|nr:MAG: anti-sigma factor [Gallionellaceae bacterium]